MTPPTRIVLLGGGYVTVFAYRRLARKLRRQIRSGDVEVVVVSPELSHAFHGWTGEVLGGLIPLAHQRSTLRHLLPHARVLHGRAVAVDPEGKTVRVRHEASGREDVLTYDHVLIGFGSQEDADAVPGLREHGWRVKGPGTLLALRNRVVEALEAAESDPEARRSSLTFVVAGGGFTGVEVCAALAEMLRAVRGSYRVLDRVEPRLVLVHAGDALLPSLRPRFDRLADYAARELAAYGVEVRLNTRLASVSADEACLSDGTSVPAAAVVSTVGMRSVPLRGLEGFASGRLGRYRTDPALRLPGAEGHWSGGDAAHVPHRQGETPCPPNALWAIKHGLHVGGNIARVVRGREPRPFRYPGLGQAASLGVGKGVLELYGVQLTGWLGWTGRLAFFLRFMPSRLQASRVVLDWLLAPFRQRDLAVLDVPPVRPAPLVHGPHSERVEAVAAHTRRRAEDAQTAPASGRAA